MGPGLWVGNSSRDKIAQSDPTQAQVDTGGGREPLLALTAACSVHGNPETMFLSWDLLSQLLSPEHFKFLIFTEILSRELDEWQSATPAGFQLNAFTFDGNASLLPE